MKIKIIVLCGIILLMTKGAIYGDCSTLTEVLVGNTAHKPVYYEGSTLKYSGYEQCKQSNKTIMSKGYLVKIDDKLCQNICPDSPNNIATAKAAAVEAKEAAKAEVKKQYQECLNYNNTKCMKDDDCNKGSKSKEAKEKCKRICVSRALAICSRYSDSR